MASETIRVRAIKTGLYPGTGEHSRIREVGDEFEIDGEKYPANYGDDKVKADVERRGKVKAFSSVWMELVNPPKKKAEPDEQGDKPKK